MKSSVNFTICEGQRIDDAIADLQSIEMASLSYDNIEIRDKLCEVVNNLGLPKHRRCVNKTNKVIGLISVDLGNSRNQNFVIRASYSSEYYGNCICSKKASCSVEDYDKIILEVGRVELKYMMIRDIIKDEFEEKFQNIERQVEKLSNTLKVFQEFVREL